MSLEAGQLFGGYTILRVLGSGGMGRVYLAAHPRLPRHDALKVLPSEVTADPQYRERFEREAELAAGLSHPHIVGIHDRGEHNGQFWISMDYVAGTDVARLLRERFPGGMPVDEAMAIITAVASALDYAHRRGVLHRDVKPANILVADSDGQGRRVYLADFGIARRIDDVTGPTTTKMAVGTVAYAAPEQLMARSVDGRADQYALACTAFHLLAGAPSYGGSSPAVVIGQHVSAPPPSIGARRPELAGLDPVFATAMAKEPSDRYGSCGEFAAQLSEHLSAPSSPQGLTVAALPRPPLPNRRRLGGRPAVLIGALLAVALLVVAGVFATARLTGRHDPAPAAGPFSGTYRADFGPIVALDDISDGRWVAVTIGSDKCRDAAAEIWEVFTLQRSPDGTFTGDYRGAAANACDQKRTVTFTRTGGVDVNSLPDPSTLPPRVASPAEALQGRYHVARNFSRGPQQQADQAVTTDCLRTGDRCMSYFHSKTLDTPLVFGGGRWTLDVEHDEPGPQCGGPVFVKVTGQYPLPQPPQDPITLLSGQDRLEQSGSPSCSVSADFAETYTRTGD